LLVLCHTTFLAVAALIDNLGCSPQQMAGQPSQDPLMPRRRTLLAGFVGVAVTHAASFAHSAPAGRNALFSAVLGGDAPPADTHSPATASADVSVDLDAQTIDLHMAVAGITLAQLWDKLKAAPIGPVHIHRYGDMQHMNDASVSLVMPVPFGPMYADSATGFSITMKRFPYAKGAALLQSALSFDDFLDSMRGGLLALNVHTNAYPDGEINGPLLARA
jgi:hypothetical protein